jgi:hypothetical protein
MKNFFLTLSFLTFSTLLCQAQRIDWHGGWPAGEYYGGGIVTEDSTSFTYDSSKYYANFELDGDGRTLHVTVTVKNIPHIDENDLAEFNITIVEDDYFNYTSRILLDQGEIWNQTGTGSSGGPIYKVYPTEDEYTYSTSIDLGTRKVPLMIYGGVGYFNGIYEPYYFNINPLFYPN